MIRSQQSLLRAADPKEVMSKMNLSAFFGSNSKWRETVFLRFFLEFSSKRKKKENLKI